MSRKVMAALAITALLLAGCAHRDRAAAPPTSSPVTTETITTAPAPPATTVPPPTGHPSRVLPDGRYPAYLSAIDVPGRTITFDVIQWFTGDAAEEAYHQDHPEIEGGPPNGYYIRNLNPRFRTLPVRQNVSVEVVWLRPDAAVEPTTFESLPDYFTGDVRHDDKYVWYDPFWLTVHGDLVESIVEQYIP